MNFSYNHFFFSFKLNYNLIYYIFNCVYFTSNFKLLEHFLFALKKKKVNTMHSGIDLVTHRVFFFSLKFTQFKFTYQHPIFYETASMYMHTYTHSQLLFLLHYITQLSLIEKRCNFLVICYQLDNDLRNHPVSS